MFNLILNTKLSKDLPFYLEDFFYSQINKVDIKSKKLKKFNKIGIIGNNDISTFPILKPKLIFKKTNEGYLLNVSTHLRDYNILTDFLSLISPYINTTNLIGYLITNHDYTPDLPQLIFGNANESIKIINISNNHTKTGIDYLAINAFPSLLNYINNTNTEDK